MAAVARPVPSADSRREDADEVRSFYSIERNLIVRPVDSLQPAPDHVAGMGDVTFSLIATGVQVRCATRRCCQYVDAAHRVRTGRQGVDLAVLRLMLVIARMGSCPLRRVLIQGSPTKAPDNAKDRRTAADERSGTL